MRWHAEASFERAEAVHGGVTAWTWVGARQRQAGDNRGIMCAGHAGKENKYI